MSDKKVTITMRAKPRDVELIDSAALKLSLTRTRFMVEAAIADAQRVLHETTATMTYEKALTLNGGPDPLLCAQGNEPMKMDNGERKP